MKQGDNEQGEWHRQSLYDILCAHAQAETFGATMHGTFYSTYCQLEVPALSPDSKGDRGGDEYAWLRYLGITFKDGCRSGGCCIAQEYQ